MIRAIAAIRTAITTAALLAGVPVLLVALGGSPIPARPPSAAQFQAWLDEPFNPRYGPGTAWAVAWLIWALLATVICAIAALRARRWRWARLADYLPGPVQGLTATVLGAATVTTAVGVPAAHAVPATTIGTTTPGPTTPIAATPGHASAGPDVHRQADPSPVVTVRRGDTLWDIAAARLGDGHRWKQLSRLNTSRYPDLRHGEDIEPGWRLTLPPTATATAAPPGHGRTRPGTPASPPPTGTAATTRTGDTPAPRATACATTSVPATALPPGRAGTTSRTPEHSQPPSPAGPLAGDSWIDLGSVARPAVSSPVGTTSTADRARSEPAAPRWALVTRDGPLTISAAGKHWTITVHRGDTLWDIAGQWLGNQERWPEIYELNAGRYDDGRMRHGDHIEAGWHLKLPDDARPPHGTGPAGPQAGPAPSRPAPSHPATAQPGTPQPTKPGTPAPAPTATGRQTSAPAATSSSGIGAITPPLTSASAHTAAPSRGNTASPTSIPTQPARTAVPPEHQTPPAADHQTEHSGVDLGEHGWVAFDVAAAVSALAALVWIQRRRRYRTRPLAGRRHDTDLTLLPTTVAALHQARPNAEDTAMDPLEPDPPQAAASTPATPGVRHQHGRLRIPDVPAQGIGLTGPGASAAGRGALAAVLTAGGPWSSDTEATVITTRADLEQLLDTSGLPELDRLIVANDALSEAEHQLLRRARIATDDDITEPTDTPAMPHTMILTAAPAGSRGHRLAAILAIGGRLGITAVLTGQWAHGQTWTVAATGNTTTPNSTNGPRLNTLDVTATVDILNTLNEARPSTSRDDLAASLRRVPDPSPPAASRTQPNPAPAAAALQAAPEPAEGATATTPPADRPAISVEVLGRPRVRVTTDDGQTEVHIRRTDGIQILVYLAVEPDGATSDQLMAALWPEVRPRYARGRFHTTMSELRGLLSDTGHSDTIRRTGERYHLNPDRVHVDVWDLNTAIEHAATALDPAEHIAGLRTAIGLYTATIADGYTWLWLVPYRETTRRQLLDAHVALADAETDLKAALNHIQDAITLDPYNEDVYQRAMRLHARLGSTDGIRRTLRALSERLAELEIPVSAQTQQIATDLIARVDARQRIASTAA